MPKNATRLGLIVKEFLEIFPTENKKTLARIICQKHPDLKLEDVRRNIRYYTGAGGVVQRKIIKDRRFLRPADGSYKTKLTPVNISVEDYIFPHKKPLILSDIHLPYHVLDALEIALEKGYKEGVDSIYLNGDILDFYQISRFTKEGGMMSIREERDMFFDLISWIRQSFDVPIYFKVGNHEERLEHYIMNKAPELASLPELSLRQFLKLDELGVEYISGRQKTLMGKLITIHGHEFGDSVFSPVNPARGLFLRAKSSTAAGHNHQTSEHHENNLKSDSMACFSIGCLCQLTPMYRPFAYTKWNHGFAIPIIDNDGSFEFNNYRIIDGKAR